VDAIAQVHVNCATGVEHWVVAFGATAVCVACGVVFFVGFGFDDDTAGVADAQDFAKKFLCKFHASAIKKFTG